MGLMQLMVQLGLNATGFQTGLKQADSAAKKFGNELSHELGSKVTQAFGFAAIEEGFRRTIEYGSKIKDLNIRTGISTDDLQKFDYAAAKTGTSLEAMVQGVEKLGIAQAKAKAGNTEMAATLQRLGLKPEQITDLANVPAHFVEIADRIRDTDVDGQVLKDMTEALGKSARELLPAFKEGLGEAGDELVKIGGLIDQNAIDKLDAADDAMKALGASMRNVFGSVFVWVKDGFDGLFTFLAAHWEATKGIFTGQKSYNDTFNAVMAGWANADADRKAENDKKSERARKSGATYEAEQTQNKNAKAADEAIDRAQVAEANKILKLREQIAEVHRKGALDGMNAAQKEVALATEVADLKRKAQQMRDYGGATDSEILEVEKDAAERENQLGQAERALFKLGRSGGSNSLVDIGNYLGSNADRAVPEKLDMLHQDLLQLLKKDNPVGTGIPFPQ